ncbi:MAG TPA: GtrA family protein, partial [Candidatus Saccharimonadales bacterium]|nr:GtrA family protein [Candidatus Saccharimonadales bacterium]
VGVINTGIDFLLLNLLVTFMALPLYSANLISAFTAMCISFVLNKTFVFHEKGQASARGFFTFIGVTLLSIWGVQTVVIFILTQQFPQPLFTIADVVQQNGLAGSFSLEFIRNNLAKFVATLASLVWNYVFYKYIVFAPQKVTAKRTGREDRS